MRLLPRHASETSSYPRAVALLAQRLMRVELDTLLELRGADRACLKIWQRALFEPLLDFLDRPGKEFRARLVESSYFLSGGRTPPPPELGLLVEILHAGSLIIDDIEDGSAVRRGRPAMHVAYGLACALNAGNWLYFFAEHLVERLQLYETAELTLRRLIAKTLLRAHHGQALDLSVRVDELAQADVESVVRMTTRLKTASLMQLSGSIGAIAASGDAKCVELLAHFGSELGTGLQMLDDLSGITCPRRAAKGDEDLRLGRPIWPWAWAAIDLPPPEYASLAVLGRQVRAGVVPSRVLAAALTEVIAQVGRRCIHAHLDRACCELEAALPHSPTLTSLRQEVARLEHSYD